MEHSITSTNPYSLAGETLALLTQHGKERVIAPRFAAVLGCRVERIDGFDTDLLGTFTREIPRAGTQLEAVRRKARIGMERSGLRVGLASEGSFGPDPGLGLLPWNVEFVLLIDDRHGIELVGRAQGPARQAHRSLRDSGMLRAFAAEVGFPGQQLVLRPDHADDPRVAKDLVDWEGLEQTFTQLLGQSASGTVFAETDLRAHGNPGRMERIAEATDDLLARLGSLCPACGTPGFACIERMAGLPCADCGAPTRETRAEVHGCIRCPHRETRSVDGSGAADPAHCDWCNP